MGRFWPREGLAMGAAGLLLLAFGHLGGTVALGAHPFWATKVVWIGIGLGVLVFAASRFWRGGWLIKAGLAVVGLGLSWGATSSGKARFVASYAEDFVAGRMWYVGWMAVICFTFVVLVLLIARRG